MRTLFFEQLYNHEDEQGNSQSADHRPNPHPAIHPLMHPPIHPAVVHHVVIHHKALFVKLGIPLEGHARHCAMATVTGKTGKAGFLHNLHMKPSNHS